MSENGFTNLGENFDEEKKETTVQPAEQGKREFPYAHSLGPMPEGGIRTDENGITCGS